MTISAQLVDRKGPFRPRALVMGGLTVVLASAIALATLVDRELGFLAIAASALAWHVAPYLLGRHRPRHAQIETAPGRIHIRAGWLSRSLRARDLRGATTCLTERGVAITLQPRFGNPLSLVVATEEEAQRILSSLGVGHHGFGHLRWRLMPRGNFGLNILADAMTLLFGWSMFALMICFGRASEALSVGVCFLMPFLLLSGAARLYGWATSARVGFDSMRLFFSRREALQWNAIERVSTFAKKIVVHWNGQPSMMAIPEGAMTDEERAIFLAQIQGAIDRAKGLGRPKAEATTRIDMLDKGTDDVRTWLHRVDAFVLALKNPGYRAATIDHHDLWTTLEDPEASSHLRAAVARVLVRVEPQARTRIDAAVAATHDDKDAKRIRVAMDEELEEAAEVLDRLER